MCQTECKRQKKKNDGTKNKHNKRGETSTPTHPFWYNYSMNIPHDWLQKNNKLTKEFEFKNFKSALQFINKVGELAESADHHPDICLHDYKFVKITLTTHSKSKVTQKDHKLAEKIEEL